MNPYTNHWPAPAPAPQVQYNPHLYIPPGYHPYYDQPPSAQWNQPFFDRSRPQPHLQPHSHLQPQPHPQPKWPIYPALAVDTTQVRYDLRKPPRDAILLSTWQQISHIPALPTPTHEFRIISKAFPWSIDIRAPTVVTCGAVFDALYAMLQEHIVDSEWGILITALHDKPCNEALQKAAKARQDKDKDKDKALKRIDWLGDTPMFKGLEKDEQFEKKRVLPGSKTVTETWVVKFGKL